MNYLHGHFTKSHRTSENRIWSGMKQRCLNPNCAGYKYYGGRGIKMCQRWQDAYINFYNDMGNKPSPTHSIDRIDPDGDYTPDNCRWATKKEQIANRRVFHNYVNKHSRIRAPNGDLVVILGGYRSQFCREHDLNAAHICGVIAGDRQSHKGWTQG